MANTPPYCFQIWMKAIQEMQQKEKAQEEIDQDNKQFSPMGLQNELQIGQLRQQLAEL